MIEEAAPTEAQRHLRALAAEVRDELDHAAKLDIVVARIDALHVDVLSLRGEVQRLVHVGEGLTTIGSWAMRWTPYIVAIMAGANLFDIQALIAAFAARVP